MSDRDADLAETAAELEQSMRDLRQELESDLSRGPLGLPRPPSPGELLRFADEAVIPAVIAILEANIKILESIQAGIRIANSRSQVTAGTKDQAKTVQSIGKDTLDQFEGAIDDLQSVIEEGGLPEHDEAREILQQARDLRESLDAEVEEASKQPPEEESEEDESVDSTVSEELDIDVDSELESIKQEYEPDDTDEDSSDVKGES